MRIFFVSVIFIAILILQKLFFRFAEKVQLSKKDVMINITQINIIIYSLITLPENYIIYNTNYTLHHTFLWIIELYII